MALDPVTECRLSGSAHLLHIRTALLGAAGFGNSIN
jgi:hypothetical protein